MRTSFALATAAAALCSGIAATAQKVVPLNIGRATGDDRGVAPLDRRGEPLSLNLNNNLTGGSYYADISLGTPPQPVRLVLDTGSSDIWVIDEHASYCDTPAAQEIYGGCITPFDANASSTFALLDDAFKIKYMDDSGTNGSYFTDTLNVGGHSVAKLQMGLGRATSMVSGVMGVGYNSNVASKGHYPNIIDQLHSHGAIASKAFSLYLNDYNSREGTILFGGIDTKRYIGNLRTMDVVPNNKGVYDTFTVALSTLTMTGVDSPNGTTGTVNLLREAVPVMLDSGTTLTYLPRSMTDQLYHTLGAVDDIAGSGLVYVDCAVLRDHRANVSFAYQFGGSDGPVIDVPIDELVLDNLKPYLEMGLEAPGKLGIKDPCSVGVLPTAEGKSYLLGDTFLRSAYVVYDLNHNQIAIAQSNLNATDSHILEITKAGIPHASGVESQVQVSQSATGLPSNPGSGDGVSPGAIASASASPSPSTAGAASALAPGLPAYALLVAGVTTVAGLLGAGMVVI